MPNFTALRSSPTVGGFECASVHRGPFSTIWLAPLNCRHGRLFPRRPVWLAPPLWPTSPDPIGLDPSPAVCERFANPLRLDGAVAVAGPIEDIGHDRINTTRPNRVSEGRRARKGN